MRELPQYYDFLRLIAHQDPEILMRAIAFNKLEIKPC